MQYFINYVLGWPSESNKKADLGTMAHKVMECLAILKKFKQENPTATTLVGTDDVLGDLSVSVVDFYEDSFLEELSNLSFEAYSSKFTSHEWKDADRKEILKISKIFTTKNDGQFDPRLRTILHPEQHFDLPIEESWAKFKHKENGKIVNYQLAIKGTIDLMTLVNESTIEVIDWKGLPLDTLLPTPSGFTTMGEIKVGDKVFDQYGKICSVVGKSQVKTKDCYRITFDDTTSAVCDDEHLWKLSNGEVVAITDLKVGDKINTTGPLWLPEIDLPIDPYLLGVWLGDGRNRSCEISSGDEEVFTNLENLGFTLGKDQEKRVETLSSRVVLDQTKKFRDLNILNNKHIPPVYFRCSINQRLELLRGLMDTDGNVNETRKQAVFTTCNKRLSDDVKHLLLTLGQRPNQSDITRDTNFKDGVRVYPVAFRPLSINPFKLSKKADKIDPSWGPGRSSVRKIVSIEQSVVQKTQCISVDSDDNTYLCTENYIPTHNTGRRMDWSSGKEKDFKKLCNDPQLLLYFYAISRLFPQYPNKIMSIFFCKSPSGAYDPKPFSIHLEEEDNIRFLGMLKDRFKEILSNKNPKPFDPTRSDFKCRKLCTFYKNKWEGTNDTMCHHIEKNIKKHGIDETIKQCTRPGFDIGFYESPG